MVAGSNPVAPTILTPFTLSLRAGRVGALSVLVHPAMVNLDEALRITWNGHLVYEEKVKPNPAHLIQNFLEERDRRLLYIARI